MSCRHRRAMQTPIVLIVAAAACAVARPPDTGTLSPPALVSVQGIAGPPRVEAPLLSGKFQLIPYYLGDEESPRLPPPNIANHLLNKEMDRSNQMEEGEKTVIKPYEVDVSRLIVQAGLQQTIAEPLMRNPVSYVFSEDHVQKIYEKLKLWVETAPEESIDALFDSQGNINKLPPVPYLDDEDISTIEEQKKKFALTPLDEGFYDKKTVITTNGQNGKAGFPHNEGGELMADILFEPARQTRQNPNLNKQKHLLEPDLGKLKAGLANKDYRLPVSLLPTDLRWLKISQHIDDEDLESFHEDGDATVSPHHIHMMDSSNIDPADSIYGIALLAAVGAALTMAVFGFAFGWFTLSRKAKAAADVDYPAYGVTGPNVDHTGDRKLAHSAHMYHYQHQKQQIIAMERTGLEQRNGSVSDPESEENEEGDYTVYECPGFATTGDIEVKNPLFSEDPTPATPGKIEVVKQQPKE